MNWWTSVTSPVVVGSVDVVRLATLTQSVLFRFQRFPTCTALYVEIVIREHGLAIIECRTLCPTAGSVADLRKSDLTRVLSDCTYINRDRIPHAAAASTSTCTPNPKVKTIGAPQSSVQTSVTLGSCQQPKASPDELSNLLCLSRT